MINVLVADDEFFVRAGLVSMLQELYPGKLSVIEVEDGLQLIEKLHNYFPDLIFLDIKMPRMNGLDAFSQAKILAPDAQWIILSGYADFSYAQQALKLGACDYVLKPISMESLKKLTDDAIEQRQKTLQDKTRTFASEIALILNGKMEVQDLTKTDYLRHYSFSGCVMLYDTSLSEDERTTIQRQYVSSLERHCMQASTFFISHALLNLQGSGLALVSGYSPENSSLAQTQLEAFYSDLSEKMQQQGNSCFQITGLLTKNDDSISELQNEIAELCSLSPVRILLMQKPLLRHTELEGIMKDKLVYQLCGMLDQFCTAYCDRNYYQLSIKKEQIIKLLEEELKLSLNMKKNIRDFLLVSLGDIVRKYEHPLLKDQWRQLADECENRILLVSRQDKEEKTDIVKQVLMYIEKNYDRNIGVSTIAEIFHITPNYLSTLFHNATGKTFVKYLTSIRIYKAKELLNNTNLPIRDVASHVGYESAKHFAKVFKEYAGCYPSEFRNSLL